MRGEFQGKVEEIWKTFYRANSFRTARIGSGCAENAKENAKRHHFVQMLLNYGRGVSRYLSCGGEVNRSETLLYV